MKAMYRILGPFLALALVLAYGESAAQSYPSKTIKFVDGYPPGGGTDIIGRVVAQKLTERVGQPVIVENRPGANSITAAEYVARSAPDGYTLFIGATGAMVYNPGLYTRLPYDPVKDFVPITMFATGPLVFAVHPSVPVKSIKELIELAKTKPGGMFYAAGAAPFHVAAELFKKQAGVDMVHVPYKGSPASITGAVAGDTSLVVVVIAPALPHLRAGKIRGLAVTGTRRSSFLRDLPTMRESGLDFECISWTALFAPAGTPPAIIDKLYREVSAILKTDSVRERFASLSYETGEMGMPPAELSAYHRADLAKWTKVIKDLNIRAD